MRDDIAIEIASELHNLNLNIIELIKTLKQNNKNNAPSKGEIAPINVCDPESFHESKNY